jgi:hypothetical protein
MLAGLAPGLSFDRRPTAGVGGHFPESCRCRVGPRLAILGGPQPVVGGHFPESGLDTFPRAVGRGGESGRQRTKSPLWPNRPLKMPAWDGAPRVSHSTVALQVVRVRTWMSAVRSARCQRSRGAVSHGKIRTGAISVREGDHVRTAVIRPPLYSGAGAYSRRRRRRGRGGGCQPTGISRRFDGGRVCVQPSAHHVERR